MPDLTELGQLLHEEHFRILVTICGLENRICCARSEEPLDPRRAEDRKQLEEVVVALDDVLIHHAFEEREIFPLICAQGRVELARLLTHEHGMIEPMAARLQILARTILELGISNERWGEFCAAGSALIVELLQHLQKEEAHIVQCLDCFLDRETDHRIAVDHLAQRAHARQAYA